MMVSSHKNTHQGDLKNFLYGFSVSQFSNAIVDNKTNEPRKKKTFLLSIMLVGCNLDLYNGLL